MKPRLWLLLLGVTFSLTPVLAYSAARLESANKVENRNLTLLPGPSLLSPSKQPSAGAQGVLSLQGEQLTPAVPPPAPSRHPAKVPEFDAQLSTGKNTLTIGSGFQKSGVTMLSPPGELKFHEQKWTFKKAPADPDDPELKAAREKYETAKAELEAVLARRGRSLEDEKK